MGNDIVAALSTALLAAPDGQTVSLDHRTNDTPQVDRRLTESAHALLRKELAHAGMPPARRADPELAARLHGIYGLLLMARRMADADRLRPMG